MTDSRHFERVAAAYERGRPGHPTALFERLERVGGLARSTTRW